MDSPELPLVTAVMPTSGTPERRRLAKLAIESFRQQSYPNRELLILNHGEQPFYLQDRNIREIMVARPNTLGELRNLAFDYVREGYIITWDDDDWHSRPRITYQLQQALHYKKSASILTSYTTLDLATGDAFVRSCKVFACGGCCGTILFSIDDHPKYAALDRREDTVFAMMYRTTDNLHLAENSPLAYIRTCHSHNTSGREHVLNVKPAQRRELTPVERAVLDQMITRFVELDAIDPPPKENHPAAAEHTSGETSANNPVTG